MQAVVDRLTSPYSYAELHPYVSVSYQRRITSTCITMLICIVMYHMLN